MKYGPAIICHIVVNQPDSFHDVAFHLLRNGDKQDEEGSNRIRQGAILMLCDMNPSETVAVRNKCIEWCKMPSLALHLTMAAHARQPSSDLVSFLSGLLLGSDPQIRSWISFFVRSGQKRRSGEEALNAYRRALSAHLGELVDAMRGAGGRQQQETVVRACALLRLYTALRGIAGMKLADNEVALLSDLITSEAPATPAGVQFVSLGLSVLIACNSLIAEPGREKKAVEWIKWLVKEEEYFERKSGVSASFGEMLLLMAIHFHSQNFTAIIDLVCQTLGMKIAIRTANLTRMRTIFTQEIFTEQVVATHAVRVPVTRELSSNIPGFLPVHCIHQLLKSRTFSKHKVPIKEWVYNQICVSSTPLHPVLPALIEVYVNSVLVPASNRSVAELTNEPITEAEIRAVFARPAFDDSPSSASSAPSASPSSPSSSSRRGSVASSASPMAMAAAGRQRRRQRRLRSPFRSSPRSSLPIIKSESGASLKLEEAEPSIPSLAAQVLVLYYVLLYEQVRLSHTRTIMATQRKVMRYSRALLAEMPIKYLLKSAERDQHCFGGIFPQLLKLSSSQYPHLCLVQDWLEDEAKSKDFAIVDTSIRRAIPMVDVTEALIVVKECPSKVMMVMEKMLMMPTDELWKYSKIFLRHMNSIIDESTPRQVKGEQNVAKNVNILFVHIQNIAELYKKLWFELNQVFPRKLWVETINAIAHPMSNSYGSRWRKIITEQVEILIHNLRFLINLRMFHFKFQDLTLDPLQVLRCDRRVFRSGPILEIVLYVLKACLAASRTYLTQHLQENPILERNSNQQHMNGSAAHQVSRAVLLFPSLVSAHHSSVIHHSSTIAQ